MNCNIGQILYAHLLNKDQEHWPDYMTITKMAINSTTNERILKPPFEVLYGKNIPLTIELLFSRESSINPLAYRFHSKMKQLVDKVKGDMHDA